MTAPADRRSLWIYLALTYGLTWIVAVPVALSEHDILPVAIWHGLFNVFTASEAGQGTVAAVMSAGVMVWAVALVFTMRPANLSREQK